MFDYLKNVVTGRYAHFGEVVRTHQRAFAYGFTQLPPPTDYTQLELLKALKLHSEASAEYLSALFFGYEGRSAPLSETDLRALTQASGARAFALVHVSLIRLSMLSEPAIGDVLVQISARLLPPETVAEAQRVASAASTRDSKACEAVIRHSALGPIFPRLLTDPPAYMLAMGYLAYFSSALNNHTLNALSQCNRSV